MKDSKNSWSQLREVGITNSGAELVWYICNFVAQQAKFYWIIWEILEKGKDTQVKIIQDNILEVTNNVTTSDNLYIWMMWLQCRINLKRQVSGYIIYLEMESKKIGMKS